MTITIPNGVVNYSGPVSPVIASYRATPQGTQQDQAIPLSIAWGSAGGPANAVNVNIEAQATSTPIGRLMSMFVDNSDCGVPVQFIFPETQWKLVVDAEAQGVFPVLALGTSFYVVATGAGANDVTNFTPFNFPVAPLALPQTQQSESATLGSLSLNNAGGVLIAAGTNGTLEGLAIEMSGAIASGTGSQTVVTVEDGDNNVIAQVGIIGGNNQTFPAASLFSQSALNVRFYNGLKVTTVSVGTGWGSGQVFVNGFWH